MRQIGADHCAAALALALASCLDRYEYSGWNRRNYRYSLRGALPSLCNCISCPFGPKNIEPVHERQVGEARGIVPSAAIPAGLQILSQRHGPLPIQLSIRSATSGVTGARHATIS